MIYWIYLGELGFNITVLLNYFTNCVVRNNSVCFDVFQVLCALKDIKSMLKVMGQSDNIWRFST